MSAKTMSAAVAAILAVSMPMAFAAEPAQPPADPAGTTAGAAPTRVMPGQMRFSDMSGATVYGRNNKDIGTVDEVVLDKDGKIAAVVIKNGGFIGIGGKDVAVSMKDMKISTDKDGKLRFALDMTENQLKSAQAFELTPPKQNTSSGSSTPPAGNTRR